MCHNNFSTLSECLIENYINETRENHLTVLNFLVQLFSTPTVICRLVSDDETRAKYPELGKGARSRSSPNLASNADCPFVFRPFAYALNDSTVKERNLLLNVDYFAHLVEMFKGHSWMIDLSLNVKRTSMFCMMTKTWISAFNFSLSISRFTHSYISAITFDDESAKSFLGCSSHPELGAVLAQPSQDRFFIPCLFLVPALRLDLCIHPVEALLIGSGDI